MSKQSTTWRDKITLGLMVAMSFFLMCDLYITPALVTELSQEYQIPKEMLGWVGSAFVLVGAIISICFGYFTDKASRKHLLVATVLIGEIPCLLTGIPHFTATVNEFLVLRVLTGIGVGGIFPLTFSLVSDYFTDKHRAKASAFIDIAWGLGAMVGPILAGIALQTAYGWRMAFIIAAVPNFPIALIFAFFATNPKRGRTESALAGVMEAGIEYLHKIKLSDFKIVLKNRSNLLLFLQGIPGCIPWGLMPFWMITFFQEVESLTHADATLLWELFGIGSAIGGISWALLGDWLFRKKPRFLPMFCVTGIFLGTLPCFIVINTTVTALGFHFAMAILGGILISVPSSNTKAMLMNINRPEHRGSVFAVFNITDSLGKGIGPAVGSILLAASGSFHFMMNVAISSWLFCGLIFSGVIFTITKDRNAMLQLLKERAEQLAKSRN